MAGFEAPNVFFSLSFKNWLYNGNDHRRKCQGIIKLKLILKEYQEIRILEPNTSRILTTTKLGFTEKEDAELKKYSI